MGQHRQQLPGVTQQHIAARCGVSRVTVSHALRGSAHVSSEKAAWIRAVAAEMGYDPATHQEARRLAHHRYGEEVLNSTIALFFPERFVEADYFLRLFQGIISGLTPLGFHLLYIAIPRSTTPEEVTLPAAFRSGVVDGALTVIPTSYAESHLQQMRACPRLANALLFRSSTPCPGVPVCWSRKS